ncbi:MAG: Uma2 family endonuclease [Oscillatoria sp. SIO1A7]|nr:Uma2 family endonuclease [Oscillatoria sp. SIO1A7]
MGSVGGLLKVIPSLPTLSLSHSFPIPPTLSHSFPIPPTPSPSLPLSPTLSHSFPIPPTLSHSFPIPPTPSPSLPLLPHPISPLSPISLPPTPCTLHPTPWFFAMTQTQIKSLTYEDYIEDYPEDGGLYELIDGRIVELRPSRRHQSVAAFIHVELTLEIRRLKLPYELPYPSSVKPLEPGQGKLPDVIVVEKAKWRQDWKGSSSVSGPGPAQLVVEVVSTNAADDYEIKRNQYEALGIPEYWIVDYLAKSKYVADKTPGVSVLVWAQGRYQKTRFTGKSRIVSPTFPELDLTVEEVIWAGEEPGYGDW